MCYNTDTATHDTYTLSLHDALPILCCAPPIEFNTVTPGAPSPSASTTRASPSSVGSASFAGSSSSAPTTTTDGRSEEHTSELQSRLHLVCRLLLEKKNR